MEMNSKLEQAVFHYKDHQLIAVTHINGKHTLLTVKEMSRKETEDFYEVNKAQEK